MPFRYVTAILVTVMSVWVLRLTVAAQDRGSLKVPNGLALSEFKGYEVWQVIAPSQTDESIKAVVGNPVMMKAFLDGYRARGSLKDSKRFAASGGWGYAKRATSSSRTPVRGKMRPRRCRSTTIC
jgi:hypothetical protein